MNLVGSYGIVLSNQELPPLAEIQQEIDRRPCLFGPELLALEPGALACLIRVRSQAYGFGYEAGASSEAIAASHAQLVRRWSRAFVFRDDGSTIGASLSAMVAEAAARTMNGTLYDRENGPLSDYGDLIRRLDGYLAVYFDDLEPYYARYPDERPKRQLPSRPAVIESKFFPGRKE